MAAGGSALLLLGLSIRPTKDLDVLALVEEGHYVKAASLPEPLAAAIADVAAAFGLPEDWLNPGPASLLDLGLPEGFEERTETRAYGALVLHVAGRKDQICFKFYAAADMGPERTCGRPRAAQPDGTRIARIRPLGADPRSIAGLSQHGSPGP